MALPLPVLRNRRIAVVDDSEAVRRSLRVLLGSRGFDVGEYRGSAELLADLDLADYDCFVIDLKLDGSDGAELLAALRAQGAGQPAVLISGWESASLEQLASQWGFAAFVRKPMMETSIADVLKRLLSGA